jgi:hypothetical protein
MSASQYLKAIATLSADDPIINTPVHVPPGWVLPPDACLNKPLLWIIRHVMGVELYEPQRQIVAAVQEHSRVSCRACQAAGKSWASSALMLAYVLAHESVVALSTAPTSRQVTAILWAHVAELHRTSRLPLGGDLLQTQWKLGPNRFAMGFTSNTGTGDMAVKFQGFHAANVLVVVDEASDVPVSVYDALKGSLTSRESHLLLIGNPTETSGTFYDSHHSLRHLYCTLKIGYKDTPNFQGDGEVAPYLITESFVEQAQAEWGGPGSPQFDVRVLGEFPSQASDSIIAVQWAEEAVKRPAPTELPRRVFEMGVDVARFGSDESAVCIRCMDEVVYTEAWNKFDTMWTADRVAMLARKYKVSAIRVDAVGVGGGVLDRLRQLQDAGELPLGIRVTEFSAASKPRDPERFKLRRDETWQALRDRFKEGRICTLPNDQKLIGQLTSIRYYHDSSNRMLVESKDVLKKRGLKSPDRAEALMLAFTVDRPVGEGMTFDRLLEESVGGTVLPNFMEKIF